MVDLSGTYWVLAIAISDDKTDVEAETPILWPPDAKSWLTGKDFDARKDWGQEEKGTTEDEMAKDFCLLPDASVH